MKNIFSKFLTNKTPRKKITIGNQNEFSGLIGQPIAVESTIENLENVNITGLSYIPETISVTTSVKGLDTSDSGSTVFLDRLSGCIVVLPKAQQGLNFEFFVVSSVTTNDYTIVAEDATFTGSLINVDTDTDNAVDAFLANGSTHVAINMNGSTSGGLEGTTIKVVCISNNKWLVSGFNLGSGIVETPFITE